MLTLTYPWDHRNITQSVECFRWQSEKYVLHGMLLISMSDKNVYKNHVFKTASIFPGISELKVVRLYLYLMWKSDNSVLSTIDKDMGEHGLICQYLGATVSLCLSVYKLILALHQNTVLISHCGPIAISSGEGLAQNRCQVITHTNIDLSSIGSLGINFNEILIKIQIFFIEKKKIKWSLQHVSHFV